MAYQFLSWARKGIGARISTPDDLGTGTAPTDVRVRIPIEMEVSGQTVTKEFLIAGPGDIIGIRQEMIVRTDPRPNSGDFEPNYFASIEFYDEDFPWRYSPAAPVGINNSHLRPWLMLVVLTENEFVKTKKNKPLSSIMVTAPEALPPHQELHLWAHVHSNFGNTNTPLEQIIGALHGQLETDPDGLFSRILCPRQLQPDVLYHAFLVPVFEAGRRAGLDLSTKDISAQQAAWTDLTEEVELPVYYRWQFRTGANADFETLLRLMEARSELDPRVGVRDLNCSHPGYIRIGETGEVPAPSPAILGMGGALKQISANPQGFDTPPAEQDFVKEVKKHLDLLTPEEDTEADPIVTIPFYGYQHAKTVSDPNPQFKPDTQGWPHELNRDPRHRSAAALGTKVVQTHQEKLMQKAWVQLPQVNEINRRINHTKLILQINDRLLQGTFKKVEAFTGKTMAMARPAAKRIKTANQANTVFQTLTASQVPDGTVSSALRRLSRPRGSVARRMKTASTGSFSVNTVFQRVNPQVTVIFSRIDAISWFRTSSNIVVTQNVPRMLPGLSSVNSNINIAAGRPLKTRATTTHILPVLNEVNAMLDIGVQEVVSNIKIPLNYQISLLDALKPEKTMLPAFRATTAGLPKPPEKPEDLLPVMAHPDFPEPTYEYLAEINSDFIVPNLNLVPPNTIALMEPNYEFIHSFMVGINHEMARELLWREYPTDQRGTYFRQFWDPGGLRAPEANPAAQTPYKDIKPIPEWQPTTSLHDFFKIGRPFPNKPLVLLLKGELLKKYPNTIVFAQKAIKKNNKLVLDDSNDINKFKFPVFSGTLQPDVRLLGFNISLTEAKAKFLPAPILGGQASFGWFFVLAEVPGEPRFGMDITYATPEAGQKNTWDNLARENFNEPLDFVRPEAPPLAINGGWPNDGNTPNNDPDLEKWARSSADLAGILLQKPAMLAIHGSELLKDF
ncbi:MAG: hypothetical protein DHS20C18_53550 [Saprospiraceae bacterium]|nr:MAG: hypothetical protein DHS20C18_53550 [Saprospiraceae bacterium]